MIRYRVLTALEQSRKIQTLVFMENWMRILQHCHVEITITSVISRILNRTGDDHLWFYWREERVCD